MRTPLPFLLLAVLAAPAHAAAPPDPVSLAVRRGLARLEKGASNYTTNRDCFSCHHQTHTIGAFVSAKRRGFSVSEGALKEQVKFTLATFDGKHEKIRKGEAVPGRNTTASYALFTLRMAGHAPDATTSALVDFLVVRQTADGSWPAQMPRPPTEGSRFTNAALALEALKHYGGEDTDSARRKMIDAAFEKGKAWLLKNTPRDTEDRVFRLRALAALKDGKRLTAARDELLKAQRKDGSWAQVADRDGDAYATATVLMALRQAGVRPEQEAYRKGAAYLLRTQTAEGAWLVTTRSKPVQRFFDNGDPGGKDQFISFAATGWAVQALLECVPLK